MVTIKEIYPDKVKELLEKGEKLNLIDVREQIEVDQGMIPGAIHIPLGEIPEKMQLLSKDEEYIFVCKAGGRSYQACMYLQPLGYNVVNMAGGMMYWNGEIK